MIAGLLGLVFNPSAWVAVGLAALVGFSSGVYKGWADSRSEAYRTEVVELRKASQRKDEIIKDQADRYLKDQEEASRLQERLNEILSSSSQADACKPSDGDIERLRRL